MFKINLPIAVISIASLFFIGGCTPSTEDIAKEVREGIEKDFKGHGLIVKELTLVHKAGNEYKGILKTKESNGEFTYSVDVIHDGENITWEISN